MTVRQLARDADNALLTAIKGNTGNALMLPKALPLISGMEKAAPIIGLISSLVMIGFGLLLITNNFHLVSSWIHNWIDWAIR